MFLLQKARKKMMNLLVPHVEAIDVDFFDKLIEKEQQNVGRLLAKLAAKPTDE